MTKKTTKTSKKKELSTEQKIGVGVGLTAGPNTCAVWMFDNTNLVHDRIFVRNWILLSGWCKTNMCEIIGRKTR